MKNLKKYITDYLYIAAGSFILAFAINYFLVPCKISTGGVSGLATVVYYLFHIPLSAITLCPSKDTLKALHNENRLTKLMVLQEELKTAPFGDVWEEYLNRENVSTNYIDEVIKYEKEVLSKR